MKSLIIPFLCVVLVSALWCSSLIYTADTTDDLKDALVDTYDQITDGDWENASASYREFLALWKSCSRIYAYYMNTTSIDEINLAVSRCSGYIRMNDGGLACGEISGIEEKLRLIRSEGILSTDNIL